MLQKILNENLSPLTLGGVMSGGMKDCGVPGSFQCSPIWSEKGCIIGSLTSTGAILAR